MVFKSGASSVNLYVIWSVMWVFCVDCVSMVRPSPIKFQAVLIYSLYHRPISIECIEDILSIRMTAIATYNNISQNAQFSMPNFYSNREFFFRSIFPQFYTFLYYRMPYMDWWRHSVCQPYCNFLYLSFISSGIATNCVVCWAEQCALCSCYRKYAVSSMLSCTHLFSVGRNAIFGQF